MNISLGNVTTTAGSTFGTNTPSKGFAFGSGDSTKPLFGGNAIEAKPFSFTSPTPQAAPALGTSPSFSFGGAKPAASPGMFGSPTPQAQPAAPAFGAAAAKPMFGLTSPPNQTVGSPGFGQPVAQQNAAPAQNMSFGAKPQASAFGSPSQPQATTGLTFGSPSFGQAATAVPAFTGFSTPASGFSTAPASGFSTAIPPPTSTTASAPQTSQSNFSFGAATTTSSSFGAPKIGGFGGTAMSFASTAAPAFGTSNVAALQTSTPQTQAVSSTGMSFGSLTSTGLNIGTTSAAPVNFANTPTAPLNFGTSATVNFNTPTTLTMAGATSQPSQPPLNFGKPAVLSTPASTGLSLPATVQATSTGINLTSSAPTSTPLNFGNASTTAMSFGTTSTPASSAATGFQLSQKPATSLGFGLTSTASSVPSSIAATSAPSGITALGAKVTAPTTSMPTLLAATTTAPAVAPQPVNSITFAQLEESINKWTIDLEDQERLFINQATQINAWDRLLIANGEKIVELNDAVQNVKNEQQSLEHELDFVLAQQKELEVLLAPMEKQLLEDSSDRMRDPEREHMYSLAENLDTQLRQMSEDLKEVIEHLNETNRSQDSSDPIVQIGRILNAHMSSMQWVDNSIAQISNKLDQLKATHDTLRRDNERSFQLTYN